MAKARRSRRTLTTLVVLVLVSLTIITIDQTSRTHHLTSGIKSVADDVFSPLRDGVNDVLHPIGDFFAGSVHYGSLQTENQKLQATDRPAAPAAGRASLRGRAARASCWRSQNLPFLADSRRSAAQTTAIDVSNFDADITIDKGRGDGVAFGMPVVGSGGLVGQVVQANHHSSIVQLVTDGQSKVGVMIGTGVSGTSSSTAVVDGQGSGAALVGALRGRVDHLAQGAGALHERAAGSGVPERASRWAGCCVSGPRRVARSSTVQVAPAADLDNLAYVDVVQWEPAP